MISTRSMRPAVAAVALAGVLAAASGAGAASSAGAVPQRTAGDSLCNISKSSAWKKAEAAIQEASPKVDAALGGQSVKDGITGAKTIANGLREHSKQLARASGDRGAREAMSQAYDSAAKAYDVISAKLPVLADGLKAGLKGDMKALTKVIGIAGKIMEPAAQAIGKLSTNWSALMKSCK